MFLIRRITGTSMLPLFRPGTIIFALRFKEPKVGDVVVARHGALEIIKRITKITKEGYFLLGDNARFSSDSRTYGWFEPAAVRGVVVGRFVR